MTTVVNPWLSVLQIRTSFLDNSGLDRCRQIMRWHADSVFKALRSNERKPSGLPLAASSSGGDLAVLAEVATICDMLLHMITVDPAVLPSSVINEQQDISSSSQPRLSGKQLRDVIARGSATAVKLITADPSGSGAPSDSVLAPQRTQQQLASDWSALFTVLQDLLASLGESASELTTD